MKLVNRLGSKLDSLDTPLIALDGFNIQCHVYLDYLNDSIVSGNKLHKLNPNLQLAVDSGAKSILSFGGAYSNHLHALAYACQKRDLTSIGIIRGELNKLLTPTLADCTNWGMALYPSARQEFRELAERLSVSGGGWFYDVLPEFDLEGVCYENLSNTWVLSEGGSNNLAIESLAAAYAPLFDQHDFTHAICATGTGATVAGLYGATQLVSKQLAEKNIKVIGIQAVAEANATEQRIKSWLSEDLKNLEIIEGHCGGFAKRPQDLLAFIENFQSQYSIPLDPIYNGKVFYRLKKLSDEGFFSSDDKLLVIHTGGLQGNRN